MKIFEILGRNPRNRTSFLSRIRSSFSVFRIIPAQFCLPHPEIGLAIHKVTCYMKYAIKYEIETKFKQQTNRNSYISVNWKCSFIKYYLVVEMQADLSSELNELQKIKEGI